jgi:hypothetical protein
LKARMASLRRGSGAAASRGDGCDAGAGDPGRGSTVIPFVILSQRCAPVAGPGGRDDIASKSTPRLGISGGFSCRCRNVVAI